MADSMAGLEVARTAAAEARRAASAAVDLAAGITAAAAPHLATYAAATGRVPVVLGGWLVHVELSSFSACSLVVSPLQLSSCSLSLLSSSSGTTSSLVPPTTQTYSQAL